MTEAEQTPLWFWRDYPEAVIFDGLYYYPVSYHSFYTDGLRYYERLGYDAYSHWNFDLEDDDLSWWLR